jgi:adenylate kinase
MPSRYKTLLLFGPPGVGKGTQGKLLSNIPGLRHLATGDMFRSLDPASELGRKFHEVSSRGELVPDELTIACWQKHVCGLVSGGGYAPSRDILILDGIPRSVAQAQAMDEHIDILKIIYLRCTNIDEMVARMKRRAKMERRSDDADESVIRRRFDVYERETAPVLSHYDKSLVAKVDALGSPAEVLRNILNVIVPVYNVSFGNPLEEPVSKVEA